MTSPQFLESLSNIPQIDYMHSRRQINPSFFLKRIKWLIKQIPGLMRFCLNTNFVHITGTSGKGTVGAILQSILACAGYKVGFYNSPHVVEVYERMKTAEKISSKPLKIQTLFIPALTFDSLTQFLKPYLEKTILTSPYGLPSYFEIVLTIALLYFQQEKCNYVILEAGCGGRYDATNIIPQNRLAIITSIGYDHEHLIGPKLSDIAYEKAGLIKKGSKVLVGPKIKGKILQVIKKEAKKKNAKLISITKNEIKKLENLEINKIIAIKTAEILKIPPNAIQNGIRKYTPLPGRLEIIKKSPLIIFDGAHNPDKIKYLLSQLNNNPAIEQLSNRTLIFASVDTKNWRAMLKLLIPYFDKIYLTRHNILHRKSADLKKMYNYTVQQCKFLGQVKIFIDPSDALRQATSEVKKNDLIIATGSLYLIGSLKKNKL
ncbi:MAG: hypothetical protein AAB525_00720 [Patescibacteria group bacterium]